MIWKLKCLWSDKTVPPGRLQNYSKEVKVEYVGLGCRSTDVHKDRHPLFIPFPNEPSDKNEQTLRAGGFLLTVLLCSCYFGCFLIPHQRCVEMQQQIVQSRSEGCVGEGQNRIYFLGPRSFLLASLSIPKKPKTLEVLCSHVCLSLLLLKIF